MANISVEVFDGKDWVSITSQEIASGDGAPDDSIDARIYFDTALSDAESSEKIFFNV